ncbi:DNA/RNA nuclease SfsA [Shouchella sp. JSM 1781072]|uniref:DNA/RNA nuclease SfsA n=1 Tax=Shouchella sp. JSM 1781072 TaxID=3344581 RepID=UPI0035C24B1E
MVVFPPLIKAKFIERPNRFILVLERQDTKELIRAHLPDPGRLKELLVKDATVWVTYSDKSTRKTKWTAVLCESEEGLYVSLQTTVANRLVESAIQTKAIDSLSEWELVRREYQVGSSRFDFLLENSTKEQLLLEVKSVTLARDGKGLFPDAPTSRGTKHVHELTELVQTGTYQTGILFVAQREAITSISSEKVIDPAFNHALEKAHEEGVKIVAVNTLISTTEILIQKEIPFFI